MTTMNKAQDNLKELVRSKYSEIAEKSTAGMDAGCCGPSASDCCDPVGNSISMAESYTDLVGYQPEADLKLGCGIPVEFAGLEPGQNVLDLGSGAGNDLFVARSVVGDSGRLTGLDFSDAMNEKARRNAEKLGYGNMEFIGGDIEAMPLESDRFDVVLSNCVLNLVPDKQKAFSEIYRVLKPGGHFSISDIVVEGQVPESVQKAAEAYVGCVSGAMQKSDYMDLVKKAGFHDAAIRKEREIKIPEEWLENEGVDTRHREPLRVLSITVTGTRS